MKTSLEGLRVLVFSTEKDSTAWLKKSLIHHGVLVSTVESPQRVLRVLKNIRMDLLIVDCQSSDAYPLIRAIRLRDSRSGANVAALLLSKDGSGETRSDALTAGFQEQVEKPVPLDRLLQVAFELTTSPQKRTSQHAR
jgi:DNA-binding response OmpR family regulator